MHNILPQIHVDINESQKICYNLEAITYIILKLLLLREILHQNSNSCDLKAELNRLNVS